MKHLVTFISIFGKSKISKNGLFNSILTQRTHGPMNKVDRDPFNLSPIQTFCRPLVDKVPASPS